VFNDVIQESTEAFLSFFDTWKDDLRKEVQVRFNKVAERFDKTYLEEEVVESEEERQGKRLLLGKVLQAENALQCLRYEVGKLEDAHNKT